MANLHEIWRAGASADAQRCAQKIPIIYEYRIERVRLAHTKSRVGPGLMGAAKVYMAAAVRTTRDVVKRMILFDRVIFR